MYRGQSGEDKVAAVRGSFAAEISFSLEKFPICFEEPKVLC